MFFRYFVVLIFLTTPLHNVTASDDIENQKIDGDVGRKKAKTAAIEKLEQMGLDLGAGEKKSDGSTYVTFIGVGDIFVGPDHKNYGNSRINAFQRALVNSMAQCVSFQETAISTSIEDFYEEVPEGREKKEVDRLIQEGYNKNQIAEIIKATKDENFVKNSPTLTAIANSADNVVRRNVNKKLAQRQIDPNLPVSPDNMKTITEKSGFKNIVKTAAYGKCKGLKRLFSYEGEKDVAVATIWSEKLSRLSSAVAYNDFRAFEGQRPGKKIKEYTKLTDTQKLANYGTDLLRDENGDYFLLTYAQASPASEKSRSINRAYKKAMMKANASLREFLGMVVKVQGDLDSAEDIVDFSDDSEEYTSNESIQESVKAVADTMKIRGIKTVGEWEVVHPDSGRTVVGVMTAWYPKSALAAKKMTKTMNKAYSPEKQSSGAQNNRSGGGNQNGATVNDYDGVGSSDGGTEDDF